jgi:hypothetical protein
MGAGMAFKAAGRRHFSLLAFGFAQVAIDVEPALAMALGWPVLHGWTHTYLGATAIGVVVALACRPLCTPILRRFNQELRFHHQQRFEAAESVPWHAALLGALAGTWSHVALDSLMHADMRPLAPFANGNALLEAVTLTQLHLGVVAAGVIGLALWIALDGDRA